MKKLLLLLTVCVTLTSCTSAGTKTESSTATSSENSSSVAVNTAETGIPEIEQLQFTDCYKSEKIELPQDLYRINEIVTFSNSDDIILIGSDENFNNIRYYRTDSTFSEYTPFEYEYPEESKNYDAVYDSVSFNLDGTFNTIVTLENHGGMKLPEENDETFDYDSYYENCESSYMICTYDKDGKLLTSALFEYPESFYTDDGYLFFGGMISDGDSFIVIDNNSVFWKISPDGKFTQLFTYENESDDNYYILSRDCNGKIVCLIEGMTLEGDVYNTSKNFYEFTDTGLSEEPILALNENNESYGIIRGYGKYRLFIPMYDALYGLNDNGELEPLINWNNSNVEHMAVTAVGENEYIGIEECNDGSTNLLRLTPRDMSELENTKIITIASALGDDFGMQEINKTINSFNNSQTDYCIKTVSIGGEIDEEGFYSADNALNMMIITGETPDIFYGLEYDNFVNYSKKGVFTDLYTLIDNDSEISREDFLPNILSALESSDDKLYSITDCFGIKTLYTKTSVWDKENWTFDEFLSAYDNAPDSFTHLYDGSNKIDMLYDMTYAMTDFIDYENVACHFDSPDFIKILEFCNRFVDEVPSPDKSDIEKWDDYHIDKQKWLGNEKILFEKGSSGTYNFVKYLNTDGDDLTFAGYPSTDGRGGLVMPGTLLCISENCENKEGAWEFIRYCIQNTKNCPIISDSFEKYMDAQMSEKQSASGIEIPPFDQQTRDKIAEYMKSCTKLGISYDTFRSPAFDKDIMAVIEEEAGLYFTGEQTVETASENIQSRISILISERS